VVGALPAMPKKRISFLCGTRICESLVSAIVAMLGAVESCRPISNNFLPKLKFSDRFRMKILEPYTP
jgi:hypothetical protein